MAVEKGLQMDEFWLGELLNLAGRWVSYARRTEKRYVSQPFDVDGYFAASGAEDEARSEFVRALISLRQKDFSDGVQARLNGPTSLHRRE